VAFRSFLAELFAKWFRRPARAPGA